MSTDSVKALVSILPRIASSEWEEVLAHIHNEAGRISCDTNDDYGAVLLEEAAESVTDPHKKAMLFRHALYRAQWFASAATSGGEGIARSTHLKCLRAKLEQTQQGAPADVLAAASRRQERG